MNKLESRRLKGFPAALLLLILGLALAACTAPPVAPPPPTQSVEELANALAAVWATQTAQAAGAAPMPATATPAASTEATTTPAAAVATLTAPGVSPEATGPAPSPAPGVTLTFAATSSPRSAAAGTVSCEIGVAPELEGAWNWQTLGCPVSDAQTVWAAWEPFQGGYMFWRDDEDAIYALFSARGTEGRQGPALTAGDAWRWDGSNPEGRGLTPPAGSYEPVRGFGRVWSDFLGGAGGQLGWATGLERGFCTTLQTFESGIVFRSDNTVRACKDGLLNMATEPSFEPLLVSIHDDAWWQRH